MWTAGGFDDFIRSTISKRCAAVDFLGAGCARPSSRSSAPRWVLLFADSAARPLVAGSSGVARPTISLRGLRPPGPEISSTLVDKRGLESLGRWPSARLVHPRTRSIDHAERKSSPSISVHPARRAGSRRSADGGTHRCCSARRRSGRWLRAALEPLADSDRDGRFAAAMRTSGHVCSRFAFSSPDLPGRLPPGSPIRPLPVRQEPAAYRFPLESQIGGSIRSRRLARCSSTRPHDHGL